MVKEVSGLNRLRVYTPVSYRPGMNFIGHKWIPKVKADCPKVKADGFFCFLSHKLQCVALGNKILVLDRRARTTPYQICHLPAP